MGVSHHQTELAFVGASGVQFANQTAVEHHDNTVAKRHHFVELYRYQQNRAAGVTHFNQLFMNKLDGADIHAAGRLAD